MLLISHSNQSKERAKRALPGSNLQDSPKPQLKLFSRNYRKMSEIIQSKSKPETKKLSKSIELRTRVNNKRNKIMMDINKNNSSMGSMQSMSKSHELVNTINLLKGNIASQENYKQKQREKITLKNLEKYYQSFVKNYESKEFTAKDILVKENNSFLVNSFVSENEHQKYNEGKQLENLTNDQGAKFLLINKWRNSQPIIDPEPVKKCTCYPRRPSTMKYKKAKIRKEVDGFKLEGWQALDRQDEIII